MRKLVAFSSVTLDGYFTNAHSDLSWAYRGNNDANTAHSSPTMLAADAKRCSFVLATIHGAFLADAGTKKEIRLWPKASNRIPKVVFSRTMDTAAWSNRGW